MSRWLAAAFLAALALGAVFRAPRLSLRPLHNDEGVNTIKFRDLYVNNSYRYDPNEFHGPTLPYFTLPAAWLSPGRSFNDHSEAMFRAVPAAFGVALIALLWLLRGSLGSQAMVWAALFAAVSPAMTYYSRDYIHEILLTFFTALTLIAAWRWLESERIGWAALAGLGLGLMAATKETFVFSLAALAVAVPCARFRPAVPRKMAVRHGGLAVGIALAVALLFFTSFFTNSAGVADAVKTYLPWVRRAGGATPHTHPWYFYLERLFWFHQDGAWFWSEGFVGLLAIVGFVAARTPRARVIGYYTLVLTLIYCALPYKTPWCLLTFYSGMILLAGMGAAALVGACRRPTTLCIVLGLLAVGCADLGFQDWRANFGTFKETLACADTMNPYVYAQTTPDIRHLVDTLDGLARVSPQRFDMPIEVVSPESYWPLPWYLRNFRQVGFWDKLPEQPLAPVMIVSRSLDARLDERPGRTHLMAGFFQLRPDVFLELYVNLDLWTRYVASLPRQAD